MSEYYEDDDAFLDKPLAEISKLHPKGQFPAKIAGLTRFWTEFKDQETKQYARKEVLVISVVTRDEEGIVRIIDSKKMTINLDSNRAALAGLLSGMFGGVKPEELRTYVPTLKSLVKADIMVNIKHESNALSQSTYAQVASFQPVPKEKGKILITPVEIPADYVPYSKRITSFQRLPDGSLFLPPRADDDNATDHQEAASRDAGNGGGKRNGKAGAKANDIPF